MARRGAERRAADLLRQPREPWRFRPDLDGAAAPPAPGEPAGRRERLLAEKPPSALHRLRCLQRRPDRPRASEPDERPDQPDDGCARCGLLPDRLPGRHAQQHPCPAPALQERALPPGARPAGDRPRAGMDRQSQPRHAEGRVRADTPDLHGHLRGRAPDRPGRDQKGFFGAGGSGPARPLSEGRRAMTMPHPDLVAVLAGLLCVLVVASAIGYVLERRLSPDGSHAVLENLNHRIRAWWVMIVLMGLALIGGKAGVTLLFAFCSFAAFREFITLTTTHRADHWALAVAFFVV